MKGLLRDLMEKEFKSEGDNIDEEEDSRKEEEERKIKKLNGPKWKESEEMLQGSANSFKQNELDSSPRVRADKYILYCLLKVEIS